MATTYEAIATVEVGSGGAANIEFTSIPATYTDLGILLSARVENSAGINDDSAMTFNSSTTGYSNRQIYGTGSSAASNSPFTTKIYIGSLNALLSTSNTFANTFIYIPNYAGSNYKSVSVDSTMENNSSSSFMSLIAGLWSNTSAITSIQLITGGNNWSQYSSATLYGIKNS